MKIENGDKDKIIKIIHTELICRYIDEHTDSFIIGIRKSKFGGYSLKIYSKNVRIDDIVKVLDEVYGLNEDKIRRIGFRSVNYILSDMTFQNIITLNKILGMN